MTRRESGVASQQGVSEEEALKRGMEAKSKEFVEKDAEVLRAGLIFRHIARDQI